MRRILRQSPKVAPVHASASINHPTLSLSASYHPIPPLSPHTASRELNTNLETNKMAPKDRTSEFHSTLASIKSRSSLPASSSSTGGKGKSEAKQPLIPKENGRSTPKAGGSKSEFGRMAGGIAKDINSTTLKLQKLAQRKSYPSDLKNRLLTIQWPREKHYLMIAQSRYPN